MTFDSGASRINMLVRLTGILLAILGVVLTYFTFSAASSSSIVPQIVPVFYLGSGLLIIVGLAAVVVNYK